MRSLLKPLIPAAAIVIQQEIIEANIASPEAFVKEKGRFPIIDKIENPDGGVVIVTGDGKGYMVRYTFSE